MTETIYNLDLRALGHKNFQELPWVKGLISRYPVIDEIAANCSGENGQWVDQVKELLDQATATDRALIHAYFKAKLGLELLSSEQYGPGAGASTKVVALRIIEATTRRL